MSHSLTGAPPRIMVVDDMPVNVTLLEFVLKGEGYAVVPFTNPEAAFQKAEAHPPDLCILDINMPILDGFEFCRRLKRNPLLQEIPVIFISSLEETLDKVKAFEAGGVDYITKPFEVAEVLARVDTHLKIRRLTENLEEEVRLRTRQLDLAYQRLSILDETKNDFLNLIAHELRTPLNGILGVTELLFENNPQDNSEGEYRHMFDEARHKMLKILDDALLLTHIKVDDPSSQASEILLQECIVGAVREASVFAGLRNVQLIYPESSSIRIFINGLLFTKALAALLETAVKFTLPGENVTLTCEDSGSLVLVHIEGTGRTIPQEYLRNFFTAFSVTDPITPGGDLGLEPAVAEKLIRLFGGVISVRNQDPPGVIFEVGFRQHTAPA